VCWGVSVTHRFLRRGKVFSTSPAKASLTILRAVTAPCPRTRYLIGKDAKLSAFLKRNLPDRWMDAIIFSMFGLPRRVKRQEGG